MKRWLTLVALSLFVACGPISPPPPPVDHTPEWAATCRVVVQEIRQREITEAEVLACVDVARRGGQVEDLRAWANALPPEPEPEVPPVPVLTRIRVEGRFFVTDAGTFRPRFLGPTSLLAKTSEERVAVLDEDVALGFNGFRVFAGDLGWANQTPALARATFPALLEEANARGLYVYLSALTGTATGFDAEAHLREVSIVCSLAVNCLLELANEPFHGTQSGVVHDPVSLLALARRVVPPGVPFTLGAPAEDEGDVSFDLGMFLDRHLSRSRDKWNQVRHIREMEGLSGTAGKPVMSGEPIGAAEVCADVDLDKRRECERLQAGRRQTDPAFFFALGALCRGFELGCVFHSEDGLNARPLGPNQRACAEAFIAGWRSLDTDERLAFKNAGWADSPIKGANFEGGVIRTYSFIVGNRGWVVLVGLTGDPQIVMQNGWTLGAIVDERTGVQVRTLTR